jgi:heme-degrading monooxygenase HmoA
MIGLFFEVTPLEGHASSYFELAAVLRPELERSGGVLFIDRYASTDRPEVILSHQWWADEESLIRWRTHTQHRAIQRAGREQHFKDYRLRIGPAVQDTSADRKVFEITRDYTMYERTEAPQEYPPVMRDPRMS